MQTFIFHVLRNYGPSNLNRNEEGYPKNCLFGGVHRGRISSQSIKRALRQSYPFDDFREAGMIDLRTRYLPQFVRGSLERRGVAQDVSLSIVRKLHELGRKGDAADTDKESEPASETTTKQLIRCAPAAIEQLCDQLLALYGTPQWSKRLDDTIQKIDIYGVDTALFGMMTTSAAWSNVRSACQVSHAFSVNKTQLEVDFFTAVDDKNNEVAMIGGKDNTIFFNSNTYYWSMAVSIGTLLDNLQNDTDLAKSVIRALIEAIFVSHPSGKQSTFFAQPPPSFFMVEMRKNIAFDYSNAFETPVAPSQSGSLVQNAISALSNYISQIDAMYPQPVNRCHLSLHGTEIPKSKCIESWEDIAEWTINNM